MRPVGLRKSLNLKQFVLLITVLTRPTSLICRPMGVKYYTHFLMNDRPEAANEFTGVVELNRSPRPSHDLDDITSILARSLDLESDDIRILHWSRLH